jgi:hypothetical protein
MSVSIVSAPGTASVCDPPASLLFQNDPVSSHSGRHCGRNVSFATSKEGRPSAPRGDISPLRSHIEGGQEQTISSRVVTVNGQSSAASTPSELPGEARQNRKDSYATSHRVEPHGAQVEPRGTPAGDPPRPESETVATPATQPTRASTFDEIFSKMPKPEKTVVWASFLGFTKDYADGGGGGGGKGSGFRRWAHRFWDAHIRFGMLSSGRGDHYDQIKVIIAERDKYWNTLQGLRNDTSQVVIVPPAIFDSPEAGTVWGEMLKTLETLEVLALSSQARVGPARDTTLETIWDNHKKLFPNCRNEQVNMIEAKLANLRACAASIDKDAVSALFAQLIMDQATIIKLSRFSENDKGFTEELKKREQSDIQVLRNFGFVSLNHADYAIRAMDYMFHGLANERHKLNKSLSDSAEIEPKKNAELFAQACMDMAVGDYLKLEGDWSRGVSTSWLFLGFMTIASSFGLVPQIGADLTFRYHLKVEKTEKGYKITFGRSRTRGAGAGLFAFAGIILFPNPVRRWIMIWGASLGLTVRRERKEEDLLSLTINDDVKSQLELLFKGSAKSPMDFLKPHAAAGSGHVNQDSTAWRASAGPDTIFAGGHKFAHRGEGQLFLQPGHFGIDVDLASNMTEHGHAYDASTKSYSTSHERQRKTPWSHQPRVVVSMGLAVMARLRKAKGLEANSTFSGGGLTGATATGTFFGFGVRREWAAKPRKGLFGKHAAPTFGSHSISRDKNGINKLTWTLNFPRMGDILEHPFIKYHGMTDCSELQEALCYTTGDNKKKINDALGVLRSAIGSGPQAKALGELQKQAGFTRPEDRKAFRQGVESLKSDLAKSQGVDPRCSPEIGKLLDLTIANDHLWPPRDIDDEITISLEASQDEINALNIGGAAKATIEAALKRANFGSMKTISITETRVKDTELNWSLLFVIGSHSKLTLAKKKEWVIGANSQPGSPDRSITNDATSRPVGTSGVPPVAAGPVKQTVNPTPEISVKKPEAARQIAPTAKTRAATETTAAQEQPQNDLLKSDVRAAQTLRGRVAWFFQVVGDGFIAFINMLLKMLRLRGNT